MEVVNHYESVGKVKRVDATEDPDTVYQSVVPHFASFEAKAKV